MVAQFEQLAAPRTGTASNFYSIEALNARMDGDKLAAAQIARLGKDGPVTVAYGEAHLGRANSIYAFLPKDKVGIVGVYSNHRFLHASAHEVDVLKGTNTEQRSLVEWMDFIKIEETGEVFANDALRQQRSNPSQQRLIPIRPNKP